MSHNMNDLSGREAHRDTERRQRMSQESLQWLNENVITGYGVKPWHYREGISREPFDGPIPESVLASFFPVIAERAEQWVDAHGNTRGDHERKRLVRQDAEESLAVVGAGYIPHQYRDTLCGLGLPYASAGMLRKGALAWVQCGDGDTVTTKDNVRFSSKLLVATSCDGSYATQFRRVTTLVVCDNTLAQATLQNEGTVTKIRHTSNSLARIDIARREYGLLDAGSEAVASGITGLIQVEITDAQIDKFLTDLLEPKHDEGRKTPKTVTAKRDAIEHWLDGAWSDYRNTAFGVLQSVDAASRWDYATSKQTPAERTAQYTLLGRFDTQYARNKDRLLEIADI